MTFKKFLLLRVNGSIRTEESLEKVCRKAKDHLMINGYCYQQAAFAFLHFPRDYKAYSSCCSFWDGGVANIFSTTNDWT